VVSSASVVILRRAVVVSHLVVASSL
jgi:hypothetical protein